MDIIEAARQLGVAIQADERYKKFCEAKKANDEDKDLQALIGEFNLARLAIDNELSKDDGEKDEQKIKEFNANLRQIYGKVMCNDSMMAFSKAKAELEEVMKRVNGIIDLSLDGADPATCEPAEGCTGSCATCGGCH